MTQLDLYEPYRGHPPHSNDTTSLEAAIAIMPSAESLREKVFAFIKKVGTYGATDDEIQSALDMEGNTQRPRRRELFLKGRIKLAGFTRKTRSGKAAEVYVVA